MKTVLVLAAAMGLSISAASAECMGHKQQESASVDTETQVASIQKKLPPTATSTESAEQTQAETPDAVQAE